MKDMKKEIEMALLDQLCKLIDSSAMEGFKPKAKGMVLAVDGEEMSEPSDVEMSEDESSEDSGMDSTGEEDIIAKLRKIAAKKSNQE